jgi:hypothetical protein
MKKALIGGFLSLIGVMGVVAVFITCALNMASSWSTPPGRFLSTVSSLEMSPLLALSGALLAAGIVIMAIEYFRPERK